MKTSKGMSNNAGPAQGPFAPPVKSDVLTNGRLKGAINEDDYRTPTFKAQVSVDEKPHRGTGSLNPSVQNKVQSVEVQVLEELIQLLDEAIEKSQKEIDKNSELKPDAQKGIETSKELMQQNREIQKDMDNLVENMHKKQSKNIERFTDIIAKQADDAARNELISRFADSSQKIQNTYDRIERMRQFSAANMQTELQKEVNAARNDVQEYVSQYNETKTGTYTPKTDTTYFTGTNYPFNEPSVSPATQLQREQAFRDFHNPDMQAFRNERAYYSNMIDDMFRNSQANAYLTSHVKPAQPTLQELSQRMRNATNERMQRELLKAQLEQMKQATAPQSEMQETDNFEQDKDNPNLFRIETQKTVMPETEEPTETAAIPEPELEPVINATKQVTQYISETLTQNPDAERYMPQIQEANEIISKAELYQLHGMEEEAFEELAKLDSEEGNIFQKFIQQEGYREVTDARDDFRNTLNAINYALNKDAPDAALLMNVSLSLPDIQSNVEYDVYDAVYTREQARQLNLKDPGEIPSLVFHKDSHLARSISESREIKKIAREILYGKNKFNDMLSGEFVSTPNLFKSIHNCTLINPHITNDKKFKVIVYDIYDFKKQDKNELPNTKTRITNNLAYFLQEAGIIQNYALWVEIEINLN